MRINKKLISLIGLFLFIRLYQLPQRVNFSMEPGMLLLDTYKMWQTKKPTLISITSSVRTKSGLAFFHGPWIFYCLLPFMLLGSWNPLFGSYFFIFANLLALIFLFKTIESKFGPRPALLAGILFSLSPKLIEYSRFVWNPNFLPLISAILIFLALKNAKKTKWQFYFFAGIMLGFGPGWHYQALGLMPVALVYLLLKKTPLKHLGFVFLGFLLGFSPFIIFELKHNFYNLNIIFTILKEGTNKNFVFPPPFYYFLFLVPFFILVIALLLERVFKSNRFVGLVIILVFSFVSLWQILPQASAGFTMPPGWNYVNLQKTKHIIMQEGKKNFNIANLLYGDTRAYALRYLLTVNQYPPLGVEQYPQADYLFVISQKNAQETINNPVWEISTFAPKKLIKWWPINQEVNLYLLEKES